MKAQLVPIPIRAHIETNVSEFGSVHPRSTRLSCADCAIACIHHPSSNPCALQHTCSLLRASLLLFWIYKKVEARKLRLLKGRRWLLCGLKAATKEGDQSNNFCLFHVKSFILQDADIHECLIRNVVQLHRT